MMGQQGICIIPARGGSKRIPRKNIRLFAGEPIIVYSIRAAREAGCFGEIMVSTDDAEIASVAQEYGASVPFMRRGATSDDYATTDSVVAEVLAEYQRRGRVFGLVCCLYATAPLVDPERISSAAALIAAGECDSAFATVRYGHPIQRAMVVRNGYTTLKWPEYAEARTQDLEPSYHDAGQFYLATVEAFHGNGGFWGARTKGVEIPETQVQDLDNEVDWRLAELKYKLLHEC